MLSFPMPIEGSKELLATAQISLKLRKLIIEHRWPDLGEALEAMTTLAEQRLDEVNTAWQEYLCHELERATKALDQAALKKALARATAVGMLPCEKPVERALDVFIDPPEFVVNLHEGDVFPSADGKLVLKIKVRGATSLHWVKNDIALREGADGGRIKGVETPELTFTHLLGRDANQKVWCIAQNKWGVITTHKVTLRTEAAPRPLMRQNVSTGAGLGGDAAEPGSGGKDTHRVRFGSSLSALIGRSPSSKRVGGAGDGAQHGPEEEIGSVAEEEATVAINYSADL